MTSHPPPQVTEMYNFLMSSNHPHGGVKHLASCSLQESFPTPRFPRSLEVEAEIALLFFSSKANSHSLPATLNVLTANLHAQKTSTCTHAFTVMVNMRQKNKKIKKYMAESHIFVVNVTIKNLGRIYFYFSSCSNVVCMMIQTKLEQIVLRVPQE